MKLNIYEQRTKAGMSLATLAEKSGVAKSYIQRLEDENANPNPTLQVMCKLAKALNVDVHCLFDCNN